MPKVTNKQIADVYRKGAAALILSADECLPKENECVNPSPFSEVWQNKDTRICFAIKKAHKNPSRSTRQIIDAAIDIIRTRMGKYSDLDLWLLREARIPDYKLSFENLQAYRYNWLQELIKEFDK